MKKNLLVILLAGTLPCAAFAAGQQTKRTAPAHAASAHATPARATPTHAAPTQLTHEPNDQIPDSDSCGLGWQVTQKKTLSATTTRGTTNAFIPPTFGMTTGTMGCAQHPLSKRDEEAVKYAYNNFDTLSIEMAEGQGEFLKGFAQSLGCSDSSFDAFSRMTQSHYRAIMNNGKASSLQMFDNVKSELKQDTVLAIRCNAV